MFLNHPQAIPLLWLWKNYLPRNPAPGARKTGDYCYVISHHSKFLRDSQWWSCWLLFCSFSLLSCLAEMMLSSVKPLERAMRAKCVCVCLSKAGKEARLVERKVWWVGVGEERLSKGLLPPADNQWAGAVTHRGRGLHAEHSQLWQPSWNWSCSGLTNIILMVLGTVSLQFRRGLSHFLEVKFQNCGSLCHDWLPRCGQWQRICLPMQETWEMWVWSLGREDPLGWEDPHENFHGQRSLAGCSPRGRKESDTIEATYHTTHTHHGYSLVIMELISSTCGGFQYLQDSSQDTAQNTVDSSWGGTKCFWLCLMTKLLLCGMWSPLSFFVSAFSHFSD